MNNCVLSHFSHVQLFETLWIVTWQTPLSMGFSRQEYWGGLPFPSPGDLPNPEIKPTSPALAGGFFTTEPPGKHQESTCPQINIAAHAFFQWFNYKLSTYISPFLDLIFI